MVISSVEIICTPIMCFKKILLCTIKKKLLPHFIIYYFFVRCFEVELFLLLHFFATGYNLQMLHNCNQRPII